MRRCPKAWNIVLPAILCLTVQNAFSQSSACTGFRTQTQGGWGAVPSGDNPAAYLASHFAATFPTGLEIGCTNKLKLTSSNAVKDFLPSGSSPAALPSGTIINPDSGYSNVLAGQLVAATLSIAFDLADASFGSSEYHLKDLVVASGTFEGWTVQEVVDEANSFIGGCGSTFSASQLNAALTGINESYVDGVLSGNYLECPVFVSGTVTHLTCYGDSSGSIALEVSGGIPGACTPVVPVPVSTCDSCTQTASGNQSLSISAGQKVCVLAGTAYTGSINMSGGELVICGNASPQNFSTTGGKIIVHGSLQVSVINLHITTEIYNYGALSSSTNITGYGLLENHGLLTVSADLNVNGNGSFHNYDTVYVSNNMQNAGTAINDGFLQVSGVFQNNSGSVFTNNCQMAVGSNFINNATFHNNGSVSSGATSYWNGSSTYNMGGNALHTTTHAHINGTINGPASGCSRVTVASNTTINGSGILSGNLDYCDQNTIETNTGSMGQNVTTNCSCTASGNSTGGYAYSWSNGASASLISGLAAGTYTVTVTDGNGSSTIKTFTVEQPLAIALNPDVENGSCSNGNEGSVQLNISSGIPPFTHLWSNGSTGTGITGLSAGTYGITVTDSNGCEAAGSVAISVEGCCNVTEAGQIGNAQSSCVAFDPQAITSLSLPSGGLGSLEYVWLQRHPGQPHSLISNANGPTYDPGTITQTTEYRRCARRSGCEDYIGESNWVTMTVGPPPVSIAVTPGSCNNGYAAVLAASVNGGTAPFNYQWSTNETTESIIVPTDGTFTLTVTDANGCQSAASATAAIYDDMEVELTSTNASNGEGNNGTVTAIVSSGAAPYVYSWSNGGTTAMITGLTGGVYTVTVTDQNGCQATKSETVSFVKG